MKARCETSEVRQKVAGGESKTESSRSRGRSERRKSRAPATAQNGSLPLFVAILSVAALCLRHRTGLVQVIYRHVAYSWLYRRTHCFSSWGLDRRLFGNRWFLICTARMRVSVKSTLKATPVRPFTASFPSWMAPSKLQAQSC